MSLPRAARSMNARHAALSPLSLRDALRRKFLTATIPGQPARLIAEDPEAAAHVAAAVAEAFIAEVRAGAVRVAEVVIAGAQNASVRERPGERAIRADERRRCAKWLRERARQMSESGGMFQDAEVAASLADELDPPGTPVPVMETQTEGEV